MVIFMEWVSVKIIFCVQKVTFFNVHTLGDFIITNDVIFVCCIDHPSQSIRQDKEKLWKSAWDNNEFVLVPKRSYFYNDILYTGLSVRHSD